jgi:predicted metal-dependent hydrolase
MATNPLPPNDEGEQWIQRNVAKLRLLLSDPDLRREISDFLSGESERYGSGNENR